MAEDRAYLDPLRDSVSAAWGIVHGAARQPRRAAVSSFGFGGSNFHIALEEYVPGRHRKEEAPRSFAGADIPTATAAPAAAAPAAPAPRKAPLRGAAVLGGGDEADVVGQGAAEVRTLDDTLARMWKSAAIVPTRELTMVTEEQIARYLPDDGGPT